MSATVILPLSRSVNPTYQVVALALDDDGDPCDYGHDDVFGDLAFDVLSMKL